MENQKPSIFSRAYTWMKKHPALTALIIGAVVAAAVFTGGAVLAPAILPLVTTIGMYAFGVTCALLMTALGLVLGVKANMHQSNWLGLASLACFFLAPLTAIGGIAAVASAPLLGVIACGLLAAAVGALGGWLCTKISCCYAPAPEKNNPSSTADQPLPDTAQIPLLSAKMSAPVPASVVRPNSLSSTPTDKAAQEEQPSAIIERALSPFSSFAVS